MYGLFGAVFEPGFKLADTSQQSYHFRVWQKAGWGPVNKGNANDPPPQKSPADEAEAAKAEEEAPPPPPPPPPPGGASFLEQRRMPISTVGKKHTRAEKLASFLEYTKNVKQICLLFCGAPFSAPADETGGAEEEQTGAKEVCTDFVRTGTGDFLFKNPKNGVPVPPPPETTHKPRFHPDGSFACTRDSDCDAVSQALNIAGTPMSCVKLGGEVATCVKKTTRKTTTEQGRTSTGQDQQEDTEPRNDVLLWERGNVVVPGGAKEKNHPTDSIKLSDHFSAPETTIKLSDFCDLVGAGASAERVQGGEDSMILSLCLDGNENGCFSVQDEELAFTIRSPSSPPLHWFRLGDPRSVEGKCSSGRGGSAFASL